MQVSEPVSAKRLLASIHDVAPCFESQVDRLADLIEARLGPARYAMLVVPDHWGRAPLSAAPAFQARLRAWAESGIEMFVHGWFHRDTAEHQGAASFKARHMTAGEGEFLGLSHAEALRRMRDGKALVEDITGKPAAGFIAPAWLYGPGAMQALGECGFALAEDHLRVWRPGHEDAPLAKGPVVTWASRSTMRTASSLAFAALARPALQPLRTLRLALHPGDVTKPSILKSADATLRAFSRRHVPSRYSALLE
jgi:predicted deacetylase